MQLEHTSVCVTVCWFNILGIDGLALCLGFPYPVAPKAG